MKFLSAPPVDDLNAIKNNSENSRLKKTSYPYLKHKIHLIRRQYKHYHLKRGNAWNIENRIIPEELKNGLFKNYNKPRPKDLKFIDDIESSSPDTCPMCGSFKTTDVDHFLPKKHYPEFSVFSKNLIPACNCNRNKATKIVGEASTKARFLHPYYDSCLNHRLITCFIEFSSESDTPKISIQSTEQGHELEASINYHINEIVIPSGIITTLNSFWSRLWVFPLNVIQTLPRSTVSNKEMLNCLTDRLVRLDQRFETPNNWESIFTHGLIHSPGCIARITARHNESLS
ncbi:hypothetical protein ACJJIK_18505 [Microbulbifer sp. ZKSA006]|uniref:hypothetical protein n=1 Tax=Microbulbifer sp. ZKSA006 TaxID=3243390 RepID=UPI004039E49F